MSFSTCRDHIEVQMLQDFQPKTMSVHRNGLILQQQKIVTLSL